MKLETEKLTLSAATGVFIIPVCTTAERTALTAAAGLLVFDSDDGTIYQHDGSDWNKINHN
jgi:hypothetical protein